MVKILRRVKNCDEHGNCDVLECRISAVAGRAVEFGTEGVGFAKRSALLHESRPLICVASSLLLAEAIRASSGWKILAAMLLSQLVIEVESVTFVEQRYVPSRSRENASFHLRLKTGSRPAS